jgi:hypothetical protein
MMMNPGKQTYRPQIRFFSIWALLVAVLIAVIVPGAQAALSENRTRRYHNFLADRTRLELDLNAELHWVYRNFYDDFAPGSLVASKKGTFPNKVFSSKAPKQVTPGTKTVEGQYIDDLGKVQPYKAHNIPDVHHHTYEEGGTL